ncbi:helix-turn-helix domain-containing protein [Chryseosolibacter indicus]|uniref:Helix-turn-helix domain-containing protein n=1 Tax=Chryseosolibacter indicus TaxID=2782351 RepID=A0ABS5VP70_9BACT|nr:helix-turn-helix transcriptional regulator [Chryseosolibacter indicus]MBT1702659.1 helix-turn-helix domain-containing protein [Chryseosolibacter indicus]
MKVEIGQKIQEVFEAKGMKLTDFADELGTVRQNVYRIFKKRHLDTGLLLKISQVLDHNFFQYYVEMQQGESIEQKQEISQLKMEALEQHRQLYLAKKEIEYLRKIIKLMEEKAELIQQFDGDVIAQ